MTTSEHETTEGPAPLTIGDRVAYRARTRGYALSATVTATTDTLDPEGVRLGHVPPLSSPWHVHLHVLTPGKDMQYQEFDVPYDPTGAPGTWDAATTTRRGPRIPL